MLGRLDRLTAIVAPIAEIRDVNVRLGEALTILGDVRERIAGKIDALRTDLGPLGELAEKIPGIG